MYLHIYKYWNIFRSETRNARSTRGCRVETVGVSRVKSRRPVCDASGAYRAIYVARFEAAVYVLHAFQKKSQETAKMDIELARSRYRMIGAKS
jgi:phage-related protein